MNIKQSSENLISYDFDVKGWESFSSLIFNKGVQIAIIIGHSDVEELSSFLEGRVSSYDFHQEISFEHVDNFHLTVLVLRVLKDLLYGHNLASFLDLSLIDLSEGSLTDNLKQLDIVWVDHGRSRVHCSFGV